MSTRTTATRLAAAEWATFSATFLRALPPPYRLQAAAVLARCERERERKPFKDAALDAIATLPVPFRDALVRIGREELQDPEHCARLDREIASEAQWWQVCFTEWARAAAAEIGASYDE